MVSLSNLCEGAVGGADFWERYTEREGEREKNRERDKQHLEGLNSTLPETPQAQEEIFGFDDIRDFRRKWPFHIPSHEVVSSKAWAAYAVFKQQCEEVTAT